MKEFLILNEFASALILKFVTFIQKYCKNVRYVGYSLVVDVNNLY